MSTRVSTRANKGQTSRYDDFVRYDDLVQQITAKVQQLTEQVQQLTNMETLKEYNTSNHTSETTNTAYIHYMYSDRQIPQYLDTSMPQYLATSIPRYPNALIPQYLNTSIPQYLDTSIPQSIGTYQNYGYLNYGGYTDYGDFRPPEVWRGGAA